ncbi:MAG: DUF58 domain-containing protein [Planctomycetes bacterium]|nr:DUF58 domain-containing protein [Planctomycetota bacterium]
MRLLDPGALAKIHRLELLARGVVEGFVAGRHKSPYKGFSVEFAEHRQYVPGDNIRDLDWRVYGKSDRYYIKQYVEETNLRATILLDASGSMSYAGRRAAKIDGRPASKFQYAQLLAASLAHLMIHQQDAVGLVTFDARIRRYIPARSRPNHLRVLLREMYETSPGAETDLAPILHDIAERAHRRGMMVLISDLFDEPDEILRALHHFRYRKHEVLLLHVMAEEELTFPFEVSSEFRDLELAGRRIQVDPRAIRAEYLDQVRRHLAKIETGCGQLNIDYVPMSTRTSFDVALSHYLARRRSTTKQ